MVYGEQLKVAKLLETHALKMCARLPSEPVKILTDINSIRICSMCSARYADSVVWVRAKMSNKL